MAFSGFSRMLRRMSWQSRSGFKRRKPRFALSAVLVGIFCGLIIGFSGIPLPMFLTATQGGADAPVSRQEQAQSLLGFSLAGRDCRIKGNIVVTTGERIYHIPGGHFYEDTRINASNGERWFCTESEAQASGWRRSKR